MATFENTVTIRRSPKDVFAFLANFENIPTWNYAISETKKTSPGPVGVGTTYRQLRSIPSRSEEGFQVTVFEPTSRLEIHGDIGPFTATISYLLAPTNDGTRLTNAVDLELSSGPLRLAAPPGRGIVNSCGSGWRVVRYLPVVGKGARGGQEKSRRWVATHHRLSNGSTKPQQRSPQGCSVGARIEVAPAVRPAW